MANTTSNTKTAGGIGAKILFENITAPGCYICNWNGHLLRVPAEGVASGRVPQINIVSDEPLYVTKISDNPYIPLTQAKTAGSNFDLKVSF